MNGRVAKGRTVFCGITERPMTEHHPTPDKEQIALLEPFDRLGLGDIQVVCSPAQAGAALAELAGAAVLGFDELGAHDFDAFYGRDKLRHETSP